MIATVLGVRYTKINKNKTYLYINYDTWEKNFTNKFSRKETINAIYKNIYAYKHILDTTEQLSTAHTKYIYHVLLGFQHMKFGGTQASVRAHAKLPQLCPTLQSHGL